MKLSEHQLEQSEERILIFRLLVTDIQQLSHQLSQDPLEIIKALPKRSVRLLTPQGRKKHKASTFREEPWEEESPD
jgi:hypothetical protein